MIDLPGGVWTWIAANARDLSRIAGALEKIAEEVARIRAALEDDSRKEDGRQ